MAKRRTFGNTWWGKQWLDALGNVDYQNRLPRGRSYYIHGNVESCEWIEREHCVEAFVSGSAYYPYTVRISLPKWDAQGEKLLLDAIAEDPALVAELLEGSLSPVVADICSRLGLAPFPDSWRSMRTSCTCPDNARICKHIAAVFYGLADQIDADPFLLFKLHGLNLQKELQDRGVDLRTATTAHALPFSELARAATETCPLPTALECKTALAQLRSLPLGTLRPMRDTLLTLFPESLTTPGDEFFREDIRKLLVAAERTIKAISGSDDEQTWFSTCIAPHLILRNIAFQEESLKSLELRLSATVTDENDFGAVLQLTIKDLNGKIRTTKLTDTAVVFEILLKMPSTLARQASPAIECWREITQLAARLLQHSIIVPALVVPSDDPESLPLFVWTPAVRNSRAEALVNSLTQACAPFAEELFTKDATDRNGNVVAQRVFLALTLAVSSLMKLTADRLPAKSAPSSLTMLLAMQTPVKKGLRLPATHLKSLLRGLRAFLLGDAYPWRPVLTLRVHQDGIKVNYGILPRTYANSAAGSLTQRPVMFSRILKEDEFKNDRFAVVSSLKTLISACPMLAAIDSSSGRPVTLSPKEIKDFLFDLTPVLTLLGVTVMLPESLRNLLKPRLIAHVDAGRGTSLLGKDAFSDFDWRVAVGDKELTHEELIELASQSGQVVRVGENYVYLDPVELEHLIETIEEQPQPSYLTKMRAALTGELTAQDQLATVVVSDEILARLKRLTEVNDIAPPRNLQATLRSYQQRGFSWLMKNLRLGIGALIADDMGLGKTLQVIAALLQLKNDGEFARHKALVVVPTTLLTNWTREIAKFAPALTVYVYHGSNRHLPEDTKNLFDVTLTTYGLVRRDAETFARHKWRVLVLDEAQAVKNAVSGQSVAVKAVKAAQTIAMTGTPVENRLTEYWSILQAVQPHLLGSLRDFTDTFATPIESDHDPDAAAAFRRLTAPFMLRRLKSDQSVIADLPERNTIDQFTTLTKEQAALYTRVLDEHLKKIAKIEQDAAEKPEAHDYKMAKRGQVLKLITNMKQICNSPSQYLKTDSDVSDSGKAACLFDILERAREADRKVLIFTQYREMGERLQKWLFKAAGESADFLHGGVPLQTRQEMIDRFQNNRSVRILLVSLKAGGTGLNLTAASCVIHYDLWWNPAVEAQATDRAYRIGQKRDVLVYRFVTAGTFEERINQMLEKKRELADLTVATGETWIGEFSSDKLKALFTLEKSATTV